MSEPLIGPNGPLRIWPPDATDSPAGQSGQDLSPQRLMVVLWGVCVVAVQVAGFVYQPLHPPENLYLFGFWLGTVWAGWAAAVWVSSRWAARPLARAGFLVAMFIWHGSGMSLVNDETAARYVVMLGGYGLIQAIVFRWVGIPQWQSQDSFSDAIGAGNRGDITRQFGIGDLIAITTLVAILITAGKSYETLLADSFWWGLIVGEAVLLAVAVLSVMSGLAQRSVAILGLFALAVAIGIGGSILLDFIESMVSSGMPISLWPIYAVLMTTFSILMVGFSALSMAPLQGPPEPVEGVSGKVPVENDKGDRETGSQSPL